MLIFGMLILHNFQHKRDWYIIWRMLRQFTDWTIFNFTIPRFHFNSCNIWRYRYPSISWCDSWLSRKWTGQLPVALEEFFCRNTVTSRNKINELISQSSFQEALHILIQNLALSPNRIDKYQICYVAKISQIHWMIYRFKQYNK